MLVVSFLSSHQSEIILKEFWMETSIPSRLALEHTIERSSAKAMASAPSSENLRRKSEISVFQRVGDRIEPCGQPFVTWTFSLTFLYVAEAQRSLRAASLKEVLVGSLQASGIA